MASIATLTIDLVGKSSQLTAEFKKANKNTKSWATQTRQLVGASAKIMATFGAAGVAALSAIYAKNAEVIDQQAKTADRLGITTEGLIGLQHAANLSGASNEELNKSLQTMQKNLGQVAQTGTGEAKDALDGLGLSAKDLKGLAPEEQFKVIAEKLKGVEDQSQKVYIAQTLMGKSGVKMINLMDTGADGISAMMQEAEDLGITFSRIDASKVEMANDAFDKAQKTTHSFGQTLAVEMAPLIAEISNMWTDSTKEAGGFGSTAQAVVNGVTKGFGILADMGRGLQVTFLLLRQGVSELANGVVQSFAYIAQSSRPLLEMVGMDTKGLQSIENFAKGFSKTNEKLGEELTDLLAAPMPSSKVEKWVIDTQAKFQQAAEKQVGGKNTLEHMLVGDSAEATPELDKQSQNLVSKTRSTYQQIFDAQLELEGKEEELATRKHEKRMAEMDASLQLLRDKNLATAEIEAEHKTAKEQAEAQHQQVLADFEKERQNKTNAGYSELLGVMGSYYDGMEGKQAGYARAAINLGQTLLDEEKRNSIVSIWSKTYETAMKANSALSAIPIVGPALGLVAAGTVITAGTAYAAKVSGLASFDGGGYTGDGPRIGGVDGKGGMYAIVHPQETVVDHTKGQRTGGGSATIINNFHGGNAREQQRLLDNNRQRDFNDARRIGRFMNRPA